MDDVTSKNSIQQSHEKEDKDSIHEVKAMARIKSAVGFFL
jgi:hypothetical protein